jgi:Protein of unknown function (DUF3443)
VRKLIAFCVITLVLTSCGGGGGSSNINGGGGGGGTTPTIAKAGPPNVEPIVIDGGAGLNLTSPSVNVPFISVTVCVPGTNTCQTISHIEVDTGSVGLRILASAITNITLPAEGDGTAANNPLAECLQFADNTVSWGSVVQADVTMPTSGETTAVSSNSTPVNIHLIGSNSAGTIPSGCQGANAVEDTVDSFGANGIIGVGPFPTDCNDGPCPINPPNAASYYSCPVGAACALFAASELQQVQDPVILFGADNNGVIVELPALAPAGAVNPSSGVVVFGVGTRSNNALGTATQLLADPDTGVIQATLNNMNYPVSYLDSGSNASFVNNTGAPTCTDNPFLCPATTLAETATLTGSNTSAQASFTIANADAIFNGNPNGTAFNNIAAPGFDQSTLDLGMPFFFGQNVYVGIESNLQDPYYGYIGN